MAEPGGRVMDGKDRDGHKGDSVRRVCKIVCSRWDKEIPCQI